MPLTVLNTREETEAGNYFVSNYPPYSFWSRESVGAAFEMLDRPPASGTPLGIYIHIPFCRKRCHFCYFKVYTDKNASEVDSYLDAVVQELTLYSERAVLGGRRPKFVYFGGGTPSYVSSRQLARLAESMQRLAPWDQADEVAFECEPGTLTEGKLQTIKDLGITRLSLGVENFDDAILQANGRAHSSKEIDRTYDLARAIGFPQVNIDLIAGMVGETDDNWRDCVQKTISLAPDSVTIYQMEVPYNTTIFKEMKALGQTTAPVAAWSTKRAWVGQAFSELEGAGYTVGSAYTVVRNGSNSRFVYRDLLWKGADMLGLGVASFSHMQGVHFQNDHEFESYCSRLGQGSLPLYRACIPNHEEKMIREFVLQMKLGRVNRSYFQEKFGVDVHHRFAAPLRSLEAQGLAAIEPDGVRLHREGLLQVDRLLHEFFLPEHRSPGA